MADGRGFSEFSRDVLVPKMWGWKWTPWQAHCCISAMEHLFRMDAKEGEGATDWQGYMWWLKESGHPFGWRLITSLVLEEREKVGR